MGTKKKGMESFPRSSLEAAGVKTKSTNGSRRRKMKYYRGLNNVRPRGTRSPPGALIAFISMPFMASSLLSCRAIRTPSRRQIPKIDPKLVSQQALLISPKHSAFSFCKIRKQGGDGEKKLITLTPQGERASKTCLQSYTYLISSASGHVTHTHGAAVQEAATTQ